MQKEKASFQVIPNCPTQTGMNLKSSMALDQNAARSCADAER
jgi:hypothetical protein